MPCHDCIEIKAELAAQKAFMGHYFAMVIKEIETSRSQSSELRDEVLQEIRSLKDQIGSASVLPCSRKTTEETISDQPHFFEIKSEDVTPTNQLEEEQSSESARLTVEHILRASSDARNAHKPAQIRDSNLDQFQESSRRFSIQELRTPLRGSSSQLAFTCEQSSTPAGDCSLELKESAARVESFAGVAPPELSGVELVSGLEDDNSMIYGHEDGRSEASSSKIAQPKFKKSKQPKPGALRKPQYSPYKYPYGITKCTMCHKTISKTPGCMWQHSAVHLGIKRFKCAYCPLTAIREITIVKDHMIQKHRDLPVLAPTTTIDREEYKRLLGLELRKCFMDTTITC